MVRKTKSGNDDGRSKSSAVNAQKARDKLLQYIQKGKELDDIESDDYESDDYQDNVSQEEFKGEENGFESEEESDDDTVVVQKQEPQAIPPQPIPQPNNDYNNIMKMLSDLKNDNEKLKKQVTHVQQPYNPYQRQKTKIDYQIEKLNNSFENMFDNI